MVKKKGIKKPGEKGANYKVTRAKLEKAIPDSYGIMLRLAKIMDVQWHTARDALDRFPDLKERFEQQRDMTLDLAESALITAISQVEGWAVKYYLSCHGRSRGYMERPENAPAQTETLPNYDFTKLPPKELKEIEQLLSRVDELCKSSA